LFCNLSKKRDNYINFSKGPSEGAGPYQDIKKVPETWKKEGIEMLPDEKKMNNPGAELRGIRTQEAN